MSTASINTGLSAAGSGGGDDRAWHVVQVTPELRPKAAERLIGGQTDDPQAAAEKFLQTASSHHIDLTHMFCTLDPATEEVREVCLGVHGSGRTVMLFVSGPRTGGGGASWIGRVRGGRAGSVAGAAEQSERVALVHRVCESAGASGGGERPPALLAQALLETREAEVARAFRVAGFLQLGDLAYMRRPLARAPGRALEQAGHPTWAAGLTVRSLEELAQSGASEEEIHSRLLLALERSYIETRDCPELCGLRSLEDVLESHRCVGVLDPTLWWLVENRDGPQGCLLLSVAPEQDSVELVYLGLAPAVRGIGLGAMLLAFGTRRLYETALAPEAVAGHPHVRGSGGMTCAVDTRNIPATKLYRRAGFERVGLRMPFVRALAPISAKH
jgi:ribosomal protein S18 acetylase RimI-like enzyme